MIAASPPSPESGMDDRGSEVGSDLAARLRSIFARSSRRLRREEQTGLTASQDSALRTVLKYGPLTPSELADHEQVSRPTATRIITGLHEKGLVDLAPAPDDGRSYLVRLSRKGAQIRQVRRERRQSYLLELIAGLSPEDRDRLAEGVAVLERMFELED